MAKPDNISGLEYYPLGAIQDTFVCTPSYLKRLNCNGFEIFERGNIMLLNKDNVSRMHINNYYAENNINPTHILEVNDMDMLIEFAKMPDSIEKFAMILDATLKEVNSDYEAKRWKDIALQPLEVIVARKGLFHDWLAKKGKLGGQHKVPRLSNTRDYIEEMIALNER